MTIMNIAGNLTFTHGVIVGLVIGAPVGAFLLIWYAVRSIDL